MKSSVQPWMLCVLGGLFLVFGQHDSIPNLVSLLDRLGGMVGVVDPAVNQLAKDSEAWAKAVNRPTENEAVAKAFEQASTASTGDVTDMMGTLRDGLATALPPDSMLAWSTFRGSTTTRLRLLRDAGKVDDTAKSHVPYLRAIAEGVRRGK